MRRSVLGVVFVVMLAWAAPCLGQTDNTKGTIFQTGGKPTIHFQKLKGSLANYTFVGTHKGKRTEVNWEKLKEFEYLSDTSARLTLRSGKVFTIQGLSRNWGTSVYTYDEINEKLSEQKIIGYDIHKIVFGEQAGSTKKCPKCDREFPADYLYCPYDKHDLNWSKVD